MAVAVIAAVGVAFAVNYLVRKGSSSKRGESTYKHIHYHWLNHNHYALQNLYKLTGGAVLAVKGSKKVDVFIHFNFWKGLLVPKINSSIILGVEGDGRRHP